MNPGPFGRVVSANFWGGSFRPKKVSRFGRESFRPNFNRERGGWCWVLMKMRVGVELGIVESVVESEGRAQVQ